MKVPIVARITLVREEPGRERLGAFSAPAEYPAAVQGVKQAEGAEGAAGHDPVHGRTGIVLRIKSPPGFFPKVTPYGTVRLNLGSMKS